MSSVTMLDMTPEKSPRLEHLESGLAALCNPLHHEDERLIAACALPKALDYLELERPEEARKVIETFGANLIPLLMVLSDPSEPLALRRYLLNFSLNLSCDYIAHANTRSVQDNDHPFRQAAFSVSATAKQHINAALLVRAIADIMADETEEPMLRKDAARHYLSFQQLVSNRFRYVPAQFDFSDAEPSP